MPGLVFLSSSWTMSALVICEIREICELVKTFLISPAQVAILMCLSSWVRFTVSSLYHEQNPKKACSPLFPLFAHTCRDYTGPSFLCFNTLNKSQSSLCKGGINSNICQDTLCTLLTEHICCLYCVPRTSLLSIVLCAFLLAQIFKRCAL